MPENKYENQKQFWENAGNIGYEKAMFTNNAVARHIMTRHWHGAVNVSRKLGLNKESKILELGCGDGYFAENIISPLFRQIDAFDVSSAAIERAKSLSMSRNINFHNEDLATYQFKKQDHWDGAFLLGFLHHVKHYTPQIITRLSRVCPSVIVVEPNGDNLIRKALEQTPSYIKAGEDSFRLKELTKMFTYHEYKLVSLQKITLIPPFLPEILLPPFGVIEKAVESNSLLNNLCSTYILGFKK